MSKLTKEELLSKIRHSGLTMGDLRDFVTVNTKIKSDVKVLIEHIDDKYLVNNWDFIEIVDENGESSIHYEAWCISKENDDSIVYIYSHY